MLILFRLTLGSDAGNSIYTNNSDQTTRNQPIVKAANLPTCTTVFSGGTGQYFV
jgi:hypothetical protein